MIRPVLLSAIVVFLAGFPADAAAQARTIQARDGDIVLVPTDATVTLVRAMPGHLRVTAHEQGRVLVVLLDEGAQPDGIVDRFYRFELLQPYPPEYVFDGAGTFEEYAVHGNKQGATRYGIVIPQGRIHVASGSPAAQSGAVPDHFAAFQSRGMSSRRVRATFDDAEREALTGVSPTGIQSRVELGISAPAGGVRVVPPPAADGPVRVGGNVRPPTKVKDVPPVLPEVARQAGVFGVVILEVTIDEEGRVSNARVLRSIPLLDQAALDAVRQWEFTPTYVDGRPRPVILTVPVPFQG